MIRFSLWGSNCCCNTFPAFWSSSNWCKFSVNNLFFVSSSGNIGIGTLSPSYSLDVNSNIGSYGATAVNIRNTNAAGEAAFSIRNDLNYYAAFELFGSAWNVTGLRNSAIFSTSTNVASLAFVTIGASNIAFRTNSTTATTPYSNYMTANTSTVITQAITTTQNSTYVLKGTLQVTTTGTFIPQVTFSAAPGGTSTVTGGAYFKIYPIGSNVGNTSIGTWA